MRSALVPRALGAVTAAYGVYTLARPHSLARVAGMLTPERPASTATRNLGWAIGARDLVSGTAMMLAPAGPALRAGARRAGGLRRGRRHRLRHRRATVVAGEGDRSRSGLGRDLRIRIPGDRSAVMSTNDFGDRRSIAVVGAGVAGLTAAYVLAQQYEVTLYEADDRLGGHAHTHDVTDPAGNVLAVDTGFIVHNDRTYPHLRRLFAELGVQRARPR